MSKKLLQQIEQPVQPAISDVTLKADALRYQWLRKQPNDTTAPRVDVVLWTSSDESVNNGEGLRLELLDATIDAAMKETE